VSGNLIADPRSAFERVYCVNLDRRPDRWRIFCEGLPKDWPFPQPERFAAVDGHLVRPPSWWKAGRGAWGCYRSHALLIERCLNEGVGSVLLLEDDALFPDGFSERVLAWLRHVPADWEVLYLGGQHLRAAINPPLKVGPELWQPYNVNRTHAWALNGSGLQAVYSHLHRIDWHHANHIDHHLGRLCQRRENRVYCPPAWLVGQAAGKSNISGKVPPDRFWTPANAIGNAKPEPADDRRSSGDAPKGEPLVVILGLHGSGSSCLAGALWHLGLWFGENLMGYWGKESPARGGEHRDLAAICERAFPFPLTEQKRKRRWIYRSLQTWINARQQEAKGRGTIAAAKYPQLCRAGRQLFNLLGDRLRVIAIERPIEESIKSIQRRAAKVAPADKLAEHQRWLEEGRQSILQNAADVLRIGYGALLNDPERELRRVVEWLDIEPTAEQMAAAVAHVKPEMRHVTSGEAA